MTITEKILAAHCGKSEVRPGEIVVCKLDGVLANDVTAPIAIREMKKLGFSTVFDRERTYFVMDHFTPNANVKAATASKVMRDFAKEVDLPFLFDTGRAGIEHALLPEQGLVQPGEMIIGGDSHTCTYGALGAFSTGMGSTDVGAGLGSGELWFKVPETIKFVYNGRLPRYITGKDLILLTIGRIGVDGALYKAMEFTGDAIRDLSMDGRFTMCNMAIEAGAKNGIVPPDEKTRDYVAEHNRYNRPVTCYESDPDAEYSAIVSFDVDELKPQVACPHLPGNVKSVAELRDLRVDQVVIGSCTNGRIEDLRAAAEVLRGQKISRYVRTIIIPATQAVYKQAMAEGLVDIFIDAGAAVSTPTCGPCFGGHMGILAAGEHAVSTTNRNFVGRMGDPTSEVYLASPYVAAASAVTGVISSPEEVL